MLPTEAGLILSARGDAAHRLIGSTVVTGTQCSAFLAIAKNGSFSAASQATGLSQPSLHRAVRDFELAMGRALLERKGRAVTLTERGQMIARRLRLAQRELEAAVSEIGALGGEKSGAIHIGAMPLCRARLLPSALVSFIREHPETDLSVVEGSHLELVEQLREGELDFIIGAMRDPSPGPDLVQQELLVDKPAIFARADHPILKAKVRDIGALARFPWVVPDRGIPLRDLFERMFEENGVPIPEVPVASGSVILIRQILLHTDCLTILSPDQLSVELEAGWLSTVCPAPDWLARTIGLTTRADWHPTTTQRALLKEIEHTASGVFAPSND